MKTRFLLLAALLPWIPASGAEQPKRYSTEFQNLIREAGAALDEQKFDIARQQVQKLEELEPNDAAVYNLKGALAVEEGRYDEAEQLLQKALELNPKLYATRFNLAEVPFRQKNYALARERLAPMQAENPKDELVQYKIFLTYLFEKNNEKAKELMDKIKFPADTPAYYYSRVAWELAHGNKEEAQKWIKSSAFVFNERINRLFASSLKEIGWL